MLSVLKCDSVIYVDCMLCYNATYVIGKGV